MTGSPTGFSFPSTFTTFVSVTVGSVMLLAWRARTRVSTLVAALAGAVLVAGWTARVSLGAHWPSDVVLTTTVCLAWIWAVHRVWLPRP